MRKRARYRRNVIMELINTEESYTRDLQLIVDKVTAAEYAGDWADVATKGDKTWGGVADLYEFNASGEFQ